MQPARVEGHLRRRKDRLVHLRNEMHSEPKVRRMACERQRLQMPHAGVFEEADVHGSMGR
jgi:hypothetical protein